MLLLRLSLILLCLGLAKVDASDWTLIKREGRDYVTLENLSRFYGFNDVKRVNNSVTLSLGSRSLRGQANSAEFYINNLKFILSYPLEEHEGKLLVSRMDLTKVIEPVMRPSRIRNAERIDTVVLDPGHGGHDKGATCRWGAEKDFTLDVARRAKAILEQQGFKVRMTRNSDVFVPLEERTRIANRYDNALFISIHFNSGANTAASGVETFTLAPRGVPSMAADGPRLSDLQPCAGNIRDAENMALATATHAALVRYSRLFDRGIKRARFVVIRDITVPGVLIEGGFLSNPQDGRIVASSSYRQGMAISISAAVQNYRRAVNRDPQPELVAGSSVKLRPAPDIGEGQKTTENESKEPVVIIPRQN